MLDTGMIDHIKRDPGMEIRTTLRSYRSSTIEECRERINKQMPTVMRENNVLMLDLEALKLAEQLMEEGKEQGKAQQIQFEHQHSEQGKYNAYRLIKNCPHCGSNNLNKPGQVARNITTIICPHCASKWWHEWRTEAEWDAWMAEPEGEE